MRTLLATAFMIIACATAQAQEAGRFQITQHPQFRGDQFLLDTETGRVWQLVTSGRDSAGKPTGVVWEEMSRLDLKPYVPTGSGN